MRRIWPGWSPYVPPTCKSRRKEVNQVLKQRIIAMVLGLALLAAIVGSAGVVADELGLSLTREAHACNVSGSSGGGC